MSTNQTTVNQAVTTDTATVQSSEKVQNKYFKTTFSFKPEENAELTRIIEEKIKIGKERLGLDENEVKESITYITSMIMDSFRDPVSTTSLNLLYAMMAGSTLWHSEAIAALELKNAIDDLSWMLIACDYMEPRM